MSQSYITIHYLNTIHTDHVWNTGANLCDRNYSRYAWKQNCKRTNADAVSAHNEAKLSLIKWKYNKCFFMLMSSSLSFLHRRNERPECELSAAVIRVELAAFSKYWKQKLQYFTLLYYLLLWTTVYQRRWVNINLHSKRRKWPSDQLIKITVRQMM